MTRLQVLDRRIQAPPGVGSDWICFLAGFTYRFVFAYRSVSTFTILMTRSIRSAGSFFLTLFLAMFLVVPFAVAQDRPEEGGHELQVWTGGGRSVPGGTKDTSVWNAGVSYGWILTAPHGPGFLNGRFELAVDAVPAFVVFQPSKYRVRGRSESGGVEMDFRHARTCRSLPRIEWRNAVYDA